MRFAVVIPLYNKGRSIRRCLQSVYSQLRTPDEVVIVDDGSTDDSLSQARVAARNDTCIISGQKAGGACARNLGIRQTTSDVVAFLDADDEWAPGFLEVVARLFADFPNIQVAGTGYQFSYPSSGTRSASFPLNLSDGDRGTVRNYFAASLGSPILTSSSTAVSRRALEQITMWPQDMNRGEDLAFFTKLALNCPVGFDTRICSTYHLEAENRTCRRIYVERQHLAVDYINDELANREITAECRMELLAYRGRLMLDCAVQNLLAGRSYLTRKFLTQYPLPAELKVRRCATMLASYLPTWIVANAFAGYQSLKGTR